MHNYVQGVTAMLVGLVTAFAGTCIAQATAMAEEKQESVTASKYFASCKSTSSQLQCLISRPWLGSSASSASAQLFASSQQTHASQPQTAVLNQAKVNALLLQAALPVLGFPELASPDFGSKQGLQGNFHKALHHDQATVQAAAAVLLPVIMANTATAAQTSSRGHATIGSRLLQKGLDSLLATLSTDSHGKKAACHASIKSAAPFALQSLVSMQHVIEHRLPALSLAVKHLLFLSPSKGSNHFVCEDAADSKTTDLCVGLLCWPPCPVAKLSQLSFKHGGAVAPEKAIQSLAEILVPDDAPPLQKVSTHYCSPETRNLMHCMS